MTAGAMWRTAVTSTGADTAVTALPGLLCTGITHGVSEHSPGPTKQVVP